MTLFSATLAHGLLAEGLEQFAVQPAETAVAHDQHVVAGSARR